MLPRETHRSTKKCSDRSIRTVSGMSWTCGMTVQQSASATQKARTARHLRLALLVHQYYWTGICVALCLGVISFIGLSCRVLWQGVLTTSQHGSTQAPLIFLLGGGFSVVMIGVFMAALIFCIRNLPQPAPPHPAVRFFVTNFCRRMLGLGWGRRVAIGMSLAVLLVPLHFGINHLLTQHTDLALIPVTNDDRMQLVIDQHPWRSIVFGFGIAPLVEEAAWRGPLLVLAALWPETSHSHTRRWVLVAAVILGSAAFGWSHHDYGMMNVASSVAGGLMYGSLALWSRSLIPSMVTHGLYNTTVALMVSTM